MNQPVFSTFADDEGWWFVSQYGDPAGPYKTKDDALYFLVAHIENLLDRARAELERSYENSPR
jgi:hypothetical protein